MFNSKLLRPILSLSVWFLLLWLTPTPGCTQEERIEIENDADVQQLQLHYSVMDRYDLKPGAIAANKFLNGLLPDEDSEQEIAKLINQLSSAEYLQRESAERQLVTLGARGVGLLSSAAVSGDTETRLRARRCLTAIEESLPQVMEAAIQVLRLDPEPKLASRQRLSTLFALCKDFSGLLVASSLADAIIAIANPQVSDVIESGVRSTDLGLRTACVRALPKCFAGDRLREFERLLVDSDDEVSLAAIESFGELQPDVSVKQLVDVLIRSESPEVRYSSIELLRCLSKQYLGFDPVSAAAPQKTALAKWDQWRRDHSPFSEKDFLDSKLTGELVPIGFLVSTNGAMLTRFDGNGKKLWALDVPLYDARQCSGGQILVTERGLNQVRLIDRDGRTIRKVGGVNSPSDAELLKNQHILILQGNGVVTEHDIRGRRVRRIAGMDTPFDADRLRNGNTLVADAGNNRIVEFNLAGEIVWQKRGLAFPNNVYRMPDGRTLYTTYTSGLVGLLSPQGDKIWEVGIENATLYSVYQSASSIYVADGRKKRILILDMNGNQIREIQLDVSSMCDVSFVTK